MEHVSDRAIAGRVRVEEPLKLGHVLGEAILGHALRVHIPAAEVVGVVQRPRIHFWLHVGVEQRHECGGDGVGLLGLDVPHDRKVDEAQQPLGTCQRTRHLGVRA